MNRDLFSLNFWILRFLCGIPMCNATLELRAKYTSSIPSEFSRLQSQGVTPVVCENGAANCLFLVPRSRRGFIWVLRRLLRDFPIHTWLC